MITSSVRDIGIRARAQLIITFNPWWFSNRDDLAAQFRDQLPKQSDTIKQLDNTLSEYSTALGNAVATATGMPSVYGGESLVETATPP